MFDILLRALANKLKQGTRKDGLWIILDIIMKIAGKVVEEGWDLIGHYLLPASIIKEQSVMEALPEKQVTMLYCEMEPKQREFYEYWREKFREEIKDTIRTQGFMQSRMKILQGLQSSGRYATTRFLLTRVSQANQESSTFFLKI